MDTFNSPAIGPRVRFAREKLGLTQDALRAALGFNDRQTISDIENGKRAVKAEELLALSEILDRDVEFFVDPFSVVAQAQYSWRASPELPGAELDRFEAEASSWIGLLRWLREQEPAGHSSLKSTLRLDINSTYESAQRSAEKLVQELNLGPVPALNLAERIERTLDIPVLFVDTGAHLPSGAISGAACHLGDLGVILVNRRESESRRNFDLAHELFHSLTWDSMRPAHRESNSVEDRKSTQRVEQLANNFASALLMPRNCLDALVENDRRQDAQYLAGVAAQLRVTVDALSWRLWNLGLIDKSTQGKLARQRRVDKSAAIPNLYSEPFAKLLHMSLAKGRLSARKAAKALGMSLAELSTLFSSYGMSAPFQL